MKIYILFMVLAISTPVMALPSLHLQNLTWPEVRDAMHEGYTRILIPTGGVEQGGEHLVLGKHNKVLKATAQQIAEELGNTLIAPIIAYVPEQPHMAFPGTISLQEDTFAALLTDTVRSLARHGFTHIYLMGDSGGNQLSQQHVVEDLQHEMRKIGVQLASLNEYYDYTKNGQVAWLEKQGYSQKEIGTHAGIRDTSEMLAVYPQGVRKTTIKDSVMGDASGGDGAATKASAEIGKKMIALKVAAAIRQIKEIEKVKHTLRMKRSESAESK